MYGLGSAGSRIVSALGDRRVQGGLMFAGLAIGLSVIAYIRSNSSPPEEGGHSPSLSTSPSGEALRRTLDVATATSRHEPSTKEIFDSATAVTKSAGGRSGGVYFVTTKEYGTRVVKAVKNPIQIHYAHQLARHFEINAPTTSILSKDDLPERFTTLSTALKEAIDDRKNTDHIVEMDMVSGMTIEQFLRESDLSPEEKTMALREFGKMALFDLVLMNGDRFRISGTSHSMNTGNIMICQEGDGADRTLSVVAIDQGFCEMPVYMGFDDVYELAQGSLKESKEAMAMAILDSLNSSFPSVFSSADSIQLEAVVKGITDSIPKLQLLCDQLRTLNTESMAEDGVPVSERILTSLSLPSDDKDSVDEDGEAENMASLSAIDFKKLETYYTSILGRLGD